MKKLTLVLSAATLALAGTVLYAEAPAMGGGHKMMMMDPMGDKTVTRAEAAAKADEVFARLDANHDGKLDKADREARLVERFNAIDSDHNGAISKDEFIAAHQRQPGMMGHEGMRPEGMGHEGMGRRMGAGMMMMRMADANKDGAITKDEFTAAALKHFDMADANHDGKLTPEERKAAMAKMHARMGGMHQMGGHDMGDMPPPPGK